MEIKKAFKENKYCLIFDKNGKVGDCLKYKKYMVEVHKEIDKVKLGLRTNAHVIEKIRKALVHCMRTGETLAINCGTMSPNFRKTLKSETDLPFEEICEFNTWRK